jgi:PAS domain S-box-containing protein
VRRFLPAASYSDGLQALETEGRMTTLIAPETTDLEALVRARTAELCESRERLALILNTVQTGILVVDERTHVVSDANRAAAKMIGRPSEEIVGRVCHGFICPAESGRCPITELGQTLDNSERVVLSADGAGVPILKTVVRAMVDGRPHLIESLVDISDLRRAQESIEKSREQYMLAVNGSNDGIWDWDPRSKKKFLSPQWKSMIGYQDHELENTFSTFEEHLHPDDRPRVLEYLQSYLNGEVSQYKIEFRFRHKDGSYLWILARGEALRDRNGVAYRMAGSHTDITDRKRAEELSRFAGMAEVATGVLHNVGNVLNSVNVTATLLAAKTRELRIDNLVTTIQLLQDRSGDLPEYLAHDQKGQRILPYLVKLGAHFQEQRRDMQIELDLLREHIEHIRRIVTTQQNYAKAAGLAEEISAAALVEDALRMIQPGFGRHKIRLEREWDNPPMVSADRHSVLQILLNLLRNAKDAIVGGNNPERVVRIRIGAHGADRVRIEVRDSGVGLARENLTRIFAHGFTTKRNGHGFGLHLGALAASHMGGSLWAESGGLGWGATFILELPIAEKAKTQQGSLP